MAINTFIDVAAVHLPAASRVVFYDSLVSSFLICTQILPLMVAIFHISNNIIIGALHSLKRRDFLSTSHTYIWLAPMSLHNAMQKIPIGPQPATADTEQVFNRMNSPVLHVWGVGNSSTAPASEMQNNCLGVFKQRRPCD